MSHYGKVWAEIRAAFSMFDKRISDALDTPNYEMRSALLDDVSRAITDRIQQAEVLENARAQAYREGQESMRERCAGVADNHILRGLVTNSVAYEIRQLEPEPEQ